MLQLGFLFQRGTTCLDRVPGRELRDVLACPWGGLSRCWCVGVGAMGFREDKKQLAIAVAAGPPHPCLLPAAACLPEQTTPSPLRV